MSAGTSLIAPPAPCRCALHSGAGAGAMTSDDCWRGRSPVPSIVIIGGASSAWSLPHFTASLGSNVTLRGVAIIAAAQYGSGAKM
ncbi:MAG: hypothetical protein ACLU38_00215 [Dysosmobacter sp.]